MILYNFYIHYYILYTHLALLEIKGCKFNINRRESSINYFIFNFSF